MVIVRANSTRAAQNAVVLAKIGKRSKQNAKKSFGMVQNDILDYPESFGAR